MKEFNKKLQQQFDLMSKSGKLFRVELSGDAVWELYLKSFDKGDNPIFRDENSSLKNCNHCKNFVRRYGNVVSVDDNYNIMSMFDFNIEGEYENSVKALSTAIKSSKIVNVFFETLKSLQSLPYEKSSKNNIKFKLGVESNEKRYTKEEAEKFGVVKVNEVRRFEHIYLTLDKYFVNTSGDSIESIISEYRDAKNVFQRAMETISLDTLTLVKDLINQGSLLNGAAHLYKIEQIIPLKKEYNDLSASHRNNWCWLKSYKLPFAKFRNELIGVLCTELSEGEDLNVACQSWNKRIDPVNYMKTTAPITQKQILEAKKFVEDNGYVESFDRRFATIDDIKVSEILHSNIGKDAIKTVSIFDNVKSTSTRHKRSEFDGVEEVSIEKFMKDILPTCTSVEAYLQNNQEGNMVSLTTANIPESKPIFKWNNNYSWTFNGNLAGKSQIKEEVKNKGGKVDGVLRFSMMWANGNGDDSDLDLHMVEPSGNMIYFSSKINHRTGGNLDVDIQRPGGKLAVENITFPTLSRMREGKYQLFVRQFSARNSKGFKAEIEFEGEQYSYSYDNPVSDKRDIQIAEITLKDGKFTIRHILEATEGLGGSKEIYGLATNEFHKVNLVCLSPNHWEDNNVGNKHYFFMLNNCKSNDSIRSFHNENLLPELAEFRKVLEILGATNMINSTDKQLSGLGFNATVRDEVILKLQGSHKRVVKVKF